MCSSVGKEIKCWSAKCETSLAIEIIPASPWCNDLAVPAQLSGLGIGLRRGFHLQRLMRALLVVKLDPVANHSAGVL